MPNHFVSADVNDYPAAFRPFRDQLEGRSMLVRRAKMIEVECVARGYVAGSGWKDYRRDGKISASRCPRPARERAAARTVVHTRYEGAIRPSRREHLLRKCLGTTGGLSGGPPPRSHPDRFSDSRAAEHAERAIIIADTKFEFGFVGDELVLADEVLTPDSSRFGRAPAISPAPRKRLTTSSTCVIIWSPSIGTKQLARTRASAGRGSRDQREVPRSIP